MIVGHTTIQAKLNAILQNDMLHHAYIFSGPEHIGKKTLAQSFAFSIVKGNNNLNFESVESFSTDIFNLEPEREQKRGVVKKKNIDIEAVRFIQRQLSLSSQEGGRRILIVDEADKLTPQAQNALLKTLEEPRSGVAVFLITSRVGLLLPTIISRCELFHLNFLNDLEMKIFAQEHGADDVAVKEIIDLAHGRPGVAHAIIHDHDFKTSLQQQRENFQQCLSKDAAWKLDFSLQLSKDTTEALYQLENWAEFAREYSRESKRYDYWYGHIDRIWQTIQLLRTTNANTRLLLERLVLSLQ